MRKQEYRNFFQNQKTHWWEQGMSAINVALLEKYLPRRRGLRILDAGCGTGVAFGYLGKYGKVVGVDKSSEALKYAQKLGKVMKADIGKLPFKDGSFDLVVCLDVLYHLWIKDYRQVLGEFNRVLKNGGLLLLREPAFAWLKSGHDVIEYGQRRFSKDQLNKDLKFARFEILKISYANFFLFPLVLLKRLPEILGLKKKQAKSDIVKTPAWLNKICLGLLQTEAKILRYGNLPFGSSLISLSRKPARLSVKR